MINIKPNGFKNNLIIRVRDWYTEIQRRLDSSTFTWHSFILTKKIASSSCWAVIQVFFHRKLKAASYHDGKWTSFPLIWNSKISWSFNRRYWMSCFHLLKKALNLVISHRFLFVFFLFENLQNVPRYWSNSVPKQLCSLLTTFVLIYFS